MSTGAGLGKIYKPPLYEISTSKHSPVSHGYTIRQEEEEEAEINKTQEMTKK